VDPVRLEGITESGVCFRKKKQRVEKKLFLELVDGGKISWLEPYNYGTWLNK
jgi:hypothetical protein